MAHLGLKPQGDHVLEVGAFDGYLVSKAEATNKVGVDLDPASSKVQHASIIRANGRSLPFRDSTFDAVLLMDVAEHEENDRELLCAVTKALKPDGVLYMSVPSRSFVAFPPFITGALHRSWGHVRPGYTLEELTELFPQGMQVTIRQWNEPLFRFFYVPNWILWRTFLPTAKLMLRLAALLDKRLSDGNHGHFFVKAQYKS